MAKTITIDPTTRIGGHAKVTIRLDDDGGVQQARFHVNEFRGFEDFCKGRMFYEMPFITERICGICPVSHHLVSAKVGDEILGVQPPRPALLLRELMHLGQTIQSHSMHFFELADPGQNLGFDADPAVRNFTGRDQEDPKLAFKAIALRKFGQQIIERLGERRAHPNFAVPGGVARSLPVADRDALLLDIDTMTGYAQEGLAIMKNWAERHAHEMETFASFPTAYLGMVAEDNTLALYEGTLRLVDAHRQEVERFDGRQYPGFIAEQVEDWSSLKFPYYRKLGWPGGAYRVGPLARLNAAERISTPLAQKEFSLFHQLRHGKTVEGSLYYHYAQLIENIHALERARELLEDPEILSAEIRTMAWPSRREGVGVIEAPRGTLWHHYWVDENGRLEKVKLIVATGNNNYALSRAIEEVARQFVHGDTVHEAALNHVEAAIRAYDPCLSCTTNAVGQMPLVIDVFSPDGSLLNQIVRS
jgi:NAD-reducing hydrogenase large subunit